MDKKNVSIIIIGLLALIVMVLVWSTISQKTNSPQTTSSLASEITPSNTSYEIISVDPDQDPTKTLFPITQIQFRLNDIVNPKTFYYQVLPFVDTYLKTSGTLVTIYPKTTWPDGTFTVTILSRSTGAHGGKLLAPYSYTFSIKNPI